MAIWDGNDGESGDNDDSDDDNGQLSGSSYLGSNSDWFSEMCGGRDDLEFGQGAGIYSVGVRAVNWVAH